MRAFAVVVSLALVSAANAWSSPEPTSVETGTTRRAKLIQRTERLGDVRPADVITAVDAAIAAETMRYPAELLLAIAWGESRLISSTVTGIACGPMQTIANARGPCTLMKIPALGFLAGVHELEAWEHDPWTRGRLELVLLGYAAGYAGFTQADHPKRAWPGWVLWRAHQLGYR